MKVMSELRISSHCPCYHPSSSMNHPQIINKSTRASDPSDLAALLACVRPRYPGRELCCLALKFRMLCRKNLITAKVPKIVRSGHVTKAQGTLRRQVKHIDSIWHDTISHHCQPCFWSNGRICSSSGKQKKKNRKKPGINTCCAYQRWSTICCLLHLATEACLSQSCKGGLTSLTEHFHLPFHSPLSGAELRIYTGSNQEFCPCLHRWSWPNNKCANSSNVLLIVTASICDVRNFITNQLWIVLFW